MNELENAINNVDDDYLIGLSNKGILKRSYKDLENSDISAEYTDISAEVSVSGEKCTIVSPIGSSKCTCPSRSICRHIITSVLWLKKNLSSQKITDHNSNDSCLENLSPDEKKEISEEFTEELSSFSLKQIQKIMKKQYYTSFIVNAENGRLPKIEETSIISVEFPDENMNVRLVHPLEYSTCTCHSRELCKHKAAAILAWQIQHKILMLKDIKINDETVHIDVQNIHNTANFIKKFIEDILSNGLVRISDDVSERAESAAILCHNSRIANSERLMRELGNRLKSYVKHSPEFNSDMLFSVIMDNAIIADKILKTDDEKKLYTYIGEFKNTYISSGTLELIPLAQRNFSSASGYEGEIYYFLNKNTESDDKFLSYSNIRPVFYENKRKASATYSAPWGLYGTINDIMNCEISLENPKLSGGKISSSSDTKANILGKANLNQNVVYKRIYTDFEKMIKDIFSKHSDAETDRLVLLSIEKCVSSESDEISQSHNIVIQDKFKNHLTIKIRYTSENKDFFKLLKSIGDLMLKKGNKRYVVFAKAYIEKGECFLYPIEIFDNIQIPDKYKESADNIEHKECKDYFYFSELFHEIRKLLRDIMQCGINSFDIYEQIKEYSSECQKSGLLFLGSKMNNLFELFDAKNHTYNSDNSQIITLISEIYNYILSGIKHTEINQAINNLKTEKEY